MGSHHENHRQFRSSRAIEQGKDRWAEGTLQTERHLGVARAPADGGVGPRARTFRPRYRQQTARVRPRRVKVCDVCRGEQLATRAIVMQHKTKRPVQFEITAATRDALQAWVQVADVAAFMLVGLAYC